MGHTCHAVDCEVSCAPRMLFCPRHWRLLPLANRRSIWATYRPGQELEGKVAAADHLRQEAADILIRVLAQGHA